MALMPEYFQCLSSYMERMVSDQVSGGQQSTRGSARMNEINMLETSYIWAGSCGAF